MSYDYYIENFKNTFVHGLSVDSLIPLSKQPTAGARNVLPSREHMPTDAFSTCWQQRQQHCCSADRSKRQPVATWVCRHCGSASRTHAATQYPKSYNQWGSGPYCWGHSSGEMKSAVSRCRSLIVSRAQCADALSCWKTKLSPATCLIAGNICCDRGTSWEFAVDFYPGFDEEMPSNAHFWHCGWHQTQKLSFVFYFIVYNHFFNFPR